MRVLLRKNLLIYYRFCLSIAVNPHLRRADIQNHMGMIFMIKAQESGTYLMQNRYQRLCKIAMPCDVGDFGKYGLLKYLMYINRR